MDINLIDKLSLENSAELENRDKSFRIVITHKKYDTSHEDDIARYLLNYENWKDMLLIRYEYYLSKTFHGLGRGDMVFWNPGDKKLYIIELKSLKDKYSNTTDTAKIEKCILQSIRYANYAMTWANVSGIPVTAIEYANGDIVITEHIEHKPVNDIIEEDNEEEEIIFLNIGGGVKLPSPPQIDVKKPSLNPWLKNQNPWTKNKVREIEEDKWFTHPGDQTETRYKIVGDTLEAERIVDYEPSSGSRRSFRKRVQRVTEECTKCTKYFLCMKNLTGDVLMQEYHMLNDSVE